MSAEVADVVLGAGVVVITALKTPDYKCCVVTGCFNAYIRYMQYNNSQLKAMEMVLQ
jgi:hypothetical protein